MNHVATIAPAPVSEAFVCTASRANDWFAATTATNKFAALHFSGYVRKRVETILPLPKWESSAVHFGSRALPWMLLPRQHRFRIRCTVSPESVVRSRLRADQAVRPPAEVKPVWQEPAVEPVDFLTQWDLFFDARFDDEQVDKQRPLSFTELRSAADAPNDRTLSRTLARLRRCGRIERRVIQTSYRLPDEGANDMK